MLKMRLEQGQAALQQALQLGVLSIGNKRVLQRGIDCLVIGDLVVDIGLVEGGAARAGELRALGLGLARQALAGGVVLGRDIELLDQRECLSFTGVWSPTICCAKARTASFLDLSRACLPASMSISPAV